MLKYFFVLLCRSIKLECLIILYAVLLHLIWAVALMFDHTVNGITGIHMLQEVIHPPFARWVFLTVAVLAFVGMLARDRKIAASLMVPQQAVLFWSAGGALVAMIAGVYADGTIRTPWFLLADQSPALLVAVLHSIAILFVAKRSS